MKSLIKSFLPQSIVNNFWHLPKAILANILYSFPTNKLTVIGITGTDGKTTTTNMIYQVLKKSGKKVSMISTINAVIGGKSFDTGFHVTSPDPSMIQKFAKTAYDAGDEYLVLEVTSHALDQYRFWGIKFDIGVITNITHEHLDYHRTFENYLKTKLKLIRSVKYAILNKSIMESYHKLVRSYTSMSTKIMTFGLSEGDFNQNDVKLKLKLPGDYNIENALAAFAASFVLNIPKEKVRKSLEESESLEGRMQEIKGRGPRVFIDFAHTPNGLYQALCALRPTTKGKLISLIGAEGYRDEGKREMMGEIAQKLSDIVIVTSVDPRGQLEEINKQISKGAIKEGAKLNSNFFVVEDRQKAIDFAINHLAKKEDTIGIFGKGHEKSMNLDGKKELPWSDTQAVRQVWKTNLN